MLLIMVVLLAPAARPLAVEPGNLNGLWRFATDPADVGERDGWQRPEFDDSAWRELRVPGLWEPLGVTDPRPGEPPKPPTPQMRWTDYDGVAWYRLRVMLPADWAGKPLRLVLGSVDDQDRTYVNGTLVGATGPGVENSVSRWRRYEVPADATRPGGAMVIALRVTDLGGPGGVPGPMLTLLPADLEDLGVTLPSEDRPVAERFADPPGSARILPIRHGWAEPLESAKLQLAADLAAGFGGVATNVRWRRYLEDPAAWDELRGVVAEARRLGAALWLYDEEGYPSLAAGGLVLRDHPEWEALGLYVADAVTRGQPVELQTPPGALVACVAVPLVNGRLDLAAARPLEPPTGDAFAWTPPAGAWHVLVITQAPLYEGTHATSNVFQNRRHPNMLVPEATEYFLRVTHDRYAAELGQDLGSIFVSTFTDEPSLMSAFLRPQPWRPLPWSPTFAADYRARWGEELQPLLPALIGDAGPLSQRTRYRFWKLVGEQVARNYFGAIREWCQAHGLRSGGHLIFEEPLLMHVPMYGDFFACLRELTAPSIDCLTSLPSTVPPHIGRLVASAGELTGNPVTMSEASDFQQRYRPPGNTTPIREVNEAEIRGSLNRQMVTGINTFTSYYTWDGVDSAVKRRLNAHVGRICTVLRGGHQVADVAVVYPVDSVWPHYVPRGHMATDNPPAVDIASAFQTVSDLLYTGGRDWCYVDAPALAAATVEGDSLVHGALRWRVLMLPGVETLPAAAWATIEAFWRAGGVVIAVGARPANTDSAFPDAATQALGERLLGTLEAPRTNAGGGLGVALEAGQAAVLPALLDSLLERDVAVVPANAPIRATHRRVDEHDVYLLINDSAQPWRGPVTTAGQGAGERWDPATGERAPLAGEVALEPYGAVLLRYSSARPRARRRGAAAVAGPRLVVVDLAAPEEGHGEFVSATLTPAERDGQPVWRADARLTRGQVDTHLFCAFRAAPTVDLSDTAFLAIETWVPAEQRAGPPLFVMVQEAGGAIYGGQVGRSLGTPGFARTYVPWDQLTAMSFAPDQDDRLDRSRVTAVLVGWGGHFGTEGDRIVFEVATPKAGKVDG